MTSTPVRMAAFGGALALAFGAAFVIGATATPYDRGTQRGDDLDEMGGMAMSETHGEGALPGLAVSEAGYTFAPAVTMLERGASVPFAFEILGPDGEAADLGGVHGSK